MSGELKLRRAARPGETRSVAGRHGFPSSVEVGSVLREIFNEGVLQAGLRRRLNLLACLLKGTAPRFCNKEPRCAGSAGSGFPAPCEACPRLLVRSC